MLNPEATSRIIEHIPAVSQFVDRLAERELPIRAVDASKFGRLITSHTPPDGFLARLAESFTGYSHPLGTR